MTLHFTSKELASRGAREYRCAGKRLGVELDAHSLTAGYRLDLRERAMEA